MVARLHRAPEQERAVQEGRRPAQRAGPDPLHLLQARLRLDRPRRPARPVPVDGPLHPARARLRRRQDRDARGGGARRRVLHDAGAVRRRPAVRRRGPRARRGRPRLRPGHRRRHRPREHPVPLDPDRGRPRDLGEARGRWASTPWRRAATRRGRSSAPPSPGSPTEEIIDGTEALAEIKRRYVGDPEFSNLPRKFKTALTGHPSHDVSPETHDVAFVGTIHPEHGPGFDLWVGGGLSTNPMLAQKMGVWIPLDEVADAWAGVDLDLPRLRLPPAPLPRPPEVPGRRLGRREVPRGPRERVPRPQAGQLRLAALARSATATTSAYTRRRTASATSASRPSPAACPAPP